MSSFTIVIMASITAFTFAASSPALERAEGELGAGVDPVLSIAPAALPGGRSFWFSPMTWSGRWPRPVSRSGCIRASIAGCSIGNGPMS